MNDSIKIDTLALVVDASKSNAADNVIHCTGKNPQLHFNLNLSGDNYFSLMLHLSGTSDIKAFKLYVDLGSGYKEYNSMLMKKVSDDLYQIDLDYFFIRSVRIDPIKENDQARLSFSHIIVKKKEAVSSNLKFSKIISKVIKAPFFHLNNFLLCCLFIYLRGFHAFNYLFKKYRRDGDGTLLFKELEELKLKLKLKLGILNSNRDLYSESKGLGFIKSLKLKSFSGSRVTIGLVEHLGDIVACEPVARAIRKKYPKAEISWVVKKEFRELLDHNPYVDQTIAVDCLTDWMKWISHNSFDQIIDLHVNGRVCQDCKIVLDKKIGRPEINGTNYFYSGNILQSFSRGAGLELENQASNVYIPDSVTKSVDSFNLPSEYIVVCPSSNDSAKDWDSDKWNDLVSYVNKKGFKVIEIGLKPLIKNNHNENFISFCGKTTILEMAEIIRRSSYYIGVDTGPSHIANALNIRSLLLLGRLHNFEKYNPFNGNFYEEKGCIIVRNNSGNTENIELENVLASFDLLVDDLAPEISDVNRATDFISEKEVAPKLIAFYLPQFHPIEENDRAWGKGFTEWRNVGKAKKWFSGHYQPRLPGDLGYYDLRTPGVMEDQARLATSHGIDAFCYYYYWFNGKKLLNYPIDYMLKNKSVDIPFCFCWANENWTRRWDGLSKEVIVPQNHNHEDDLDFIREVLPSLEDDRYLKVNGKPVLIVYRTDLFPNPLKTSEIWRSEARNYGFSDLYLIRCESNDPYTDPRSIGFDASYEVPTFILPDHLKYDNVDALKISAEFSGRIFDYEKIVDYYCSRERVDYKRYRSPMLAWDNTARHGSNSLIFHGVNPSLYEAWLSDCYVNCSKDFVGEERLIFVNAWNEWAEGSYLEPDLVWGHSFLDATKNVMKQSGK